MLNRRKTCSCGVCGPLHSSGGVLGKWKLSFLLRRPNLLCKCGPVLLYWLNNEDCLDWVLFLPQYVKNIGPSLVLVHYLKGLHSYVVHWNFWHQLTHKQTVKFQWSGVDTFPWNQTGRRWRNIELCLNSMNCRPYCPKHGQVAIKRHGATAWKVC